MEGSAKEQGFMGEKKSPEINFKNTFGVCQRQTTKTNVRRQIMGSQTSYEMLCVVQSQHITFTSPHEHYFNKRLSIYGNVSWNDLVKAQTSIQLQISGMTLDDFGKIVLYQHQRLKIEGAGAVLPERIGKRLAAKGIM